MQACPQRTLLPNSIGLLSANGYGQCITTDSEGSRPGARDSATVFTGISNSSWYKNIFILSSSFI